MALVTCNDLITLALKTAGITGMGQTPTTEDTSDAMSLLQMMMSQWQQTRWLVPSLLDLAVTSTGAMSYSIGPGEAFSTVLPDRIESAFVRLNSGAGMFSPGDFSAEFNLDTSGLASDYPLDIIEAREDYNQIRLKSLSTFPAAVFYDNGWPNALVYFWPIPPANIYELHLTVKAALPVYVNLTDALNVPPEYIEGLLYSMAVRLAINWGQEPRPATVGAMRKALNTIRMANTQVGTLSMPGGLGGSGRGGIAAGSDASFIGGR